MALTAVILPALPALAAAPWLPPVALAPASTAVPGTPSVAVAADGSSLAVFTQGAAPNQSLVVAARVPGGGFGPATELATAGPAISSVEVAVTPQGDAVVVWLQGGVVRVRSRPAGGGFGPAQGLSGTDAVAASMTTSSTGGAAVTWSAGSASAARVFAAVRAPGQSSFGAAAPYSPATDTLTLFGAPQVAMDAAGDVAVLWQRYVDLTPTDRYVMETATRPAGGVPGSAQSLSSTSAGSAGSSAYDVQATASGRFFAVWDYTPDSMPSNTYYADRSGTGAFQPAQQLASSTSNPKAAMNDSGTVAVAFASSGAVATSVRAASGAGFSPPTTVSAATALEFNATVAMNAAGEAVVAWPSAMADDYRVYAARRRPGATSFAETGEVAAGSASASVSYNNLDVSLDDQGNGFLTSVRQAGSEYTVVASGLDNQAPAIASVGVPASVAAGAAAAFSASATDRMSTPSLTWTFGDGGSGSGANVSHTYTAAGTYTVTVTATDGVGNRTSATRTYQVTAAAAAAPPAVPKVAASVRTSTAPGGNTRITSLSVKKLARGDTVSLSCRGSGCTKKAKHTTKVKKGSKVVLTPYVGGLTLSPGTKLTVTVKHAGAPTRKVTYTMVKGKKPKTSRS